MIHLITGNTGSGKTTYTQHLKQKTNGVLFSIDKWNKTLFFPDKNPTDGLDWFLERIERSETLIIDFIHQLEAIQTDSILDLGLSKYTHREKFRTFAQDNGYKCQLHFLDIPKEIRLQRVLNRNEQQGDTFEFNVSEEDFEFMETWFEKPIGDELKNAIIVKS